MHLMAEAINTPARKAALGPIAQIKVETEFCGKDEVYMKIISGSGLPRPFLRTLTITLNVSEVELVYCIHYVRYTINKSH